MKILIPNRNISKYKQDIEFYTGKKINQEYSTIVREIKNVIQKIRKEASLSMNYKSVYTLKSKLNSLKIKKNILKKEMLKRV